MDRDRTQNQCALYGLYPVFVKRSGCLVRLRCPGKAWKPG